MMMNKKLQIRPCQVRRSVSDQDAVGAPLYKGVAPLVPFSFILLLLFARRSFKYKKKDEERGQRHHEFFFLPK